MPVSSQEDSIPKTSIDLKQHQNYVKQEYVKNIDNLLRGR
jgi:hypothetical protein